MPRPEGSTPSMLERFRETECERDTLEGFLEWLSARGIQLAVWATGEHLHPAHQSNHELIANFLGIDLRQLERERRALFEQASQPQP